MQPLLKYGSFGEHVGTLQGALNLWPPARPTPLAVDRAYGPKTTARVHEFQKASSLSSDGVVGPNTWAALAPFLEMLLGVKPPANDLDAGLRIVHTAEMVYGLLGWGGGPVVPSPLSMKIAAARCTDANVPPTGPRHDYRPTWPRQGGLALQNVFQVAGAGGLHAARCPWISDHAMLLWKVSNSEATYYRNNYDLPAWCGIFCYYVYRQSGINLGGWVNHKANMETLGKFRVLKDPTQAFPGCIGVEDGVRGGGRNHHFIVVSNEKGVIHSIDGNSFNILQGDYTVDASSIIARRTYTHATLRTNSAYFLFPDFSKL